MKKRAILSTFGLLVVSVFLPVYASDSNGTVSNSAKYGWGENIGWVNFAPTNGGSYYGLTVTDASVAGYAWSPTFGWINFNPTNSGQGVSNTTEGHLSGSAWVAGLGWLPMNGVTINSSGKFTGTAGTEGSNVGRVSFDCSNCNVTTDWRPVSSRHVVSGESNNQSGPTAVSTPGASSPGPNMNPDLPPSTDSNVAGGVSTLPVLAGQSGGVTVTGGNGTQVSVYIPEGTFNEDITVTITPEVLTEFTSPSPDVSAFVINGVVYNIVAKDKNGNIIHNFKKKISITIDIPKSLAGAPNLSIYYLNESNPSNLYWVLIPDAVFSGSKVTITVDHLTRFALFRAVSQPSVIPVGVGISSHTWDFTYQYVFLAIVFIILLVIGLFRRRTKADRA